jgi:hypothetical protein
VFSNNVHFIDTTGAVIPGPVSIEAIKYIGNATGTVTITCTQSGKTLWQEAGTANLSSDYAPIFAGGGITVALTNGAKVFIYLKSGR